MKVENKMKNAPGGNEKIIGIHEKEKMQGRKTENTATFQPLSHDTPLWKALFSNYQLPWQKRLNSFHRFEKNEDVLKHFRKQIPQFFFQINSLNFKKKTPVY